MMTLKRLIRLSPAFGAAALLLLGLSAAPASAGFLKNIFGGGNPQNNGGAVATPDEPQPQQESRGLFGGRGGPFGGGTSRRDPDQPYSGAFHGDDLPPQEGTEATRQWITNPELGVPTLSTKNIESTRAAIQRYEQIVAQGGWPVLPAVAMKPGSTGPQIELLHRRLEISGDLVGQSVPNEYDAAVVAAVKKFQGRHGLPPTGIIDNRVTVEALNVPAAVRLGQLQANLARLQSLAPSAAATYVAVNIPAAQVEAVSGGQIVSRHAAVVGKPERPTPELSSKVQEVNFNPYWYVPKSIIYKDLVPKGQEFARKGQDMMAAYHMEAFDAAGNPIPSRAINWSDPAVYNYNFRQLPWAENSLGFIKINFPNKDAVYMHDTPLKSLFGRNERFDSSGCVRVHNVEGLSAWILTGTGWDLQRIAQVKQTGEQIDVKVAKPLPVYFTYISAWATPDGTVNFRPDIYGHDAGSETASVN
ncbi:MAG TPA: L,D-transpeptidase family protein [Methyloceanibacter sp.]|nr:L,D-transpeptidase family protein [Methyloceanibacter sp.]